MKEVLSLYNVQLGENYAHLSSFCFLYSHSKVGKGLAKNLFMKDFLNHLFS